MEGRASPPVHLYNSKRIGKFEQRLRGLQQPGQALSQSAVQPPVLLPHQDSVVPRYIVKTHRQLHHAPIKRRQDFQHSVQIDFMKNLPV
jgi:hypothetical protein